MSIEDKLQLALKILDHDLQTWLSRKDLLEALVKIPRERWSKEMHTSLDDLLRPM